MKTGLLLASLVVAVASGTASAQDVGGAFNMGQLTGSLSQDHVTQSESARAQGDSADDAAISNRTRRNCASVSKLKARYGADHPSIPKIVQLCRQGGYAIR
jgi:hypothetical protein